MMQGVEAYNDTLSANPGLTRGIQRKIDDLRGKRARVLETFFDGIIGKDARDEKLADIDREIASYERIGAERPPAPLDRTAVYQPWSRSWSGSFFNATTAGHSSGTSVPRSASIGTKSNTST
jgi:hypothetical protein